jgi:hypothetical protein
MGQERRQRSGRAVGVLDDRIARPGAVLGCERRAVRPFAGLDREGPDQAVVRRLPGLGPVALELEVLVVLNEDGIDGDERGIGLGVEGDERVEGVDVVGRADAEDAALDDLSGGLLGRLAARLLARRYGLFAGGRRRLGPQPAASAASSAARAARSRIRRFIALLLSSPALVRYEDPGL